MRIPTCLITVLAFFLFISTTTTPIAQASTGWSPKIEWKLENVGKLSSDLQIGPNGLFYASSGNKITVFNPKGQILWSVTENSSSGSFSPPVFDHRGSIFLPGRDQIKEIKLNGSIGWTFNVYSSGRSNNTILTDGPGDLLYLHLPTALYAVDTVGRYRWMLYQWNMARNNSTKLEEFKVLAATGDRRAVYAVVSRNTGGYQLLALDRDGELYWRYSLGELNNAHLVVGPDDILYVTTNPAKADRSSMGALHAFDLYGNGRPLWSYRLENNNLGVPVPSQHNQLYFIVGDELIVLNQTTGKELWSNNFPKIGSPPTVDEDSRRIYLGGDKNQLLALRPNGRLDWWLDLGSKTSIKPYLAPDGYLYVATDAGNIYKIKDIPPS